MKCCTTPIGWPRYEPQRYRFAISNSVWDYHLKPVEFVIFSYLCCASACNPEMIAVGVHLTTATVKKYLSTLGRKGLLDSFNFSTDKNFFTLPNEIFLLHLPHSAFMVYAYLLLIENRQTHTCHPSYNTIAADTGFSKNTVMKSINVLLEKDLITMEHNRYFDKHGMKWKGNNLYTILPVRRAMDAFCQRQLQQIGQTKYDRRCPRNALCASVSAQAAQSQARLSEPLYAP